MMIEVVTDNRNRTVADLRHHLTRAGGNMAEAGSVAWQFKRVAYYSVPLQGNDPDKIFEAAVEAGADDVLHRRGRDRDRRPGGVLQGDQRRPGGHQGQGRRCHPPVETDDLG